MGAAAARRSLQTCLLPISPKPHPSARDALATAMKSAERLLRTACARARRSISRSPNAPASGSRELLKQLPPMRRTSRCFQRAPADATR
eukprot:scaffold25057_cov123-Isochrysis_galbana.AAC.1